MKKMHNLLLHDEDPRNTERCKYHFSEYLVQLNLQLKIFGPVKYSESIFFDDIVKMQVLTLKYVFHNPLLSYKESCKWIQ